VPGLTVIMASGRHASVSHKPVWFRLFSGIFSGFDGIQEPNAAFSGLSAAMLC